MCSTEMAVWGIGSIKRTLRAEIHESDRGGQNSNSDESVYFS